MWKLSRTAASSQHTSSELNCYEESDCIKKDTAQCD